MTVGGGFGSLVGVGAVAHPRGGHTGGATTEALVQPRNGCPRAVGQAEDLALGIGSDGAAHVEQMVSHGPLIIFAAVAIQAGLMMLGIGLLGEMQVRHYHEPAQRAPYSVDRVLRAENEESAIPE